MDVTVIRDYLGHASIATTNRYIATNLKMKRAALEAFWERSGLAETKSVPWQPKATCCAFSNPYDTSRRYSYYQEHTAGIYRENLQQLASLRIKLYSG